MAKAPTAFDESLARAQNEMAKTVFMQALGRMPGSITMGQLVADIAATPFGETFNGMTLNSFLGAVNGNAAKPAATGGERSTRTQEGRDAIDAEISAYLETSGTVAAEVVRGAVGGTAAQIRDSMSRLMEAGLVVRTGDRRSTRYTCKAGKGNRKAK
jgi:hypothetical protein